MDLRRWLYQSLQRPNLPLQEIGLSLDGSRWRYPLEKQTWVPQAIHLRDDRPSRKRLPSDSSLVVPTSRRGDDGSEVFQ